MQLAADALSMLIETLYNFSLSDSFVTAVMMRRVISKTLSVLGVFRATLYRYAGIMSREDADAVLQHRQNGTFLIRQSINPTRREEPLTLSVKSVIMHCIIV